MQVMGTGAAAAYRVALPLVMYQKVLHADLSDVRVFNGSGEQVPFAIERPAAGTVSNAATALDLFPLKDDSRATLDAVRVTIESGRGAINVQTGTATPPPGRISTYLAKSIETSVAALRVEWPEDAEDFAGRIRVEAGDTLSDWRPVVSAAPIANLHSSAGRLVEQRVEFAPTKAKYWRLSWAGSAAPFALTSVLAEPAKQNVDAMHMSLTAAASPAGAASEPKKEPGEFEFNLGARVPVDRVNLELPDANTVVDVELLSRASDKEAWHPVRRSGFYRLKSDGEELRNGPVSVLMNTDMHWLLRTDPKKGGLGSVAPRLVVEWVPHEVVFVARGAGPFYIAYGSATANAAALHELQLPKNLSISSASVSIPNRSEVKADCNRRPYRMHGRPRCCGRC